MLGPYRNLSNSELKGTQMNQDQAKGKLDQATGTAKKAWGKLTDNDSKKAEGSFDKAHGVIQEKLGDAKQAIKSKADKLP